MPPSPRRGCRSTTTRARHSPREQGPPALTCPGTTFGGRRRSRYLPAGSGGGGASRAGVRNHHRNPLRKRTYPCPDIARPAGRRPVRRRCSFGEGLKYTRRARSAMRSRHRLSDRLRVTTPLCGRGGRQCAARQQPPRANRPALLPPPGAAAAPRSTRPTSTTLPKMAACHRRPLAGSGGRCQPAPGRLTAALRQTATGLPKLAGIRRRIPTLPAGHRHHCHRDLGGSR